MRAMVLWLHSFTVTPQLLPEFIVAVELLVQRGEQAAWVLPRGCAEAKSKQCHEGGTHLTFVKSALKLTEHIR